MRIYLYALSGATQAWGIFASKAGRRGVFATPIDFHGDYVRFDEQHRAAITERGE
jgi:hypothetical protein